MKTTSRIPRAISNFMEYLKTTAVSLFQPSLLPPVPPTAAVAVAPDPGVAPGQLNWQRLNMLESDANQWRNYYLEADVLFSKYVDKQETRTTAITDKLKIVKRKFIAFAQPQLNAIAAWRGSTVDDFEVFHIKSGELRDTTRSREALLPIIEPIIEVIKMKHLVHQILVSFPGTKSRSLPKGVKEILIYRFASEEDLPDEGPPITNYVYVGDAKRGFYSSVFENHEEGYTAWYIARIKNSRGEFGPWSPPIRALIA